LKNITIAAALLMLAAGLTGCGSQERMTVGDTCDELNAIVAEANASGKVPAEDPEVAKKSADAMKDLAGRGAEPLQDPLELLAAKLTGGGAMSELTAEEEAASNQIEKTCEF
jgi:hypothetical protein